MTAGGAAGAPAEEDPAQDEPEHDPAHETAHETAPSRRGLVRGLLGAGALLLTGTGGVLLGRALPTAPQESSVDVGFCRDMANHHAQAVTMATAAVQRAPSQEVRTLAVDVVLTQQNQIGRMQALLVSWGRALASPGESMRWMADHSGHDMTGMSGTDMGGLMPGMATAAELGGLEQLAGGEYEVRFLQLLLRHHEGGLSMAEYGRDHATTDDVRSLAAAIATSQRQESTVLTDLLRARGWEPLPLERM